MNQKSIQRINPAYLLPTIFVPLVLIFGLGFIGATQFREGGVGAVIFLMCPTAVSVVWWIFGPTTIWRIQKKAMEKKLDQEGFTRNQTFYGSSHTVVVDIRKGRIALLFFWNPFVPYILPASRVSFLFLIDGIKIRVNTFTSNQRWKMDDPKILEAISKADMMVQILETAKQASGS